MPIKGEIKDEIKKVEDEVKLAVKKTVSLADKLEDFIESGGSGHASTNEFLKILVQEIEALKAKLG